VHHKLLVKKPAQLTWVEAASVLETFLTGDVSPYYTFICTHMLSKHTKRFVTMSFGWTALQALVFCGDLRSGEDVLIHAGASGVGVAACQIARMYGA
jgi:NADPH:quinone reductase-like Zn-dependent oxidoreductase